MNKRRLHHIQTKLHWLKPWYFLVLAAVCAVACVFALRANNQHMIVMRDAVYQADRDNTDVQKPLKDLQAYVTSHMNTDLQSGSNAVYPPIQLKYTYERLSKIRNEELAKLNNQIYNTAQTSCEQQFPAGVSGRGRINCVEQYIQSHATNQLPTIQDDLYKFSFASPRWSPDLAGWAMAAALLSIVLFIVTAIGKLWLKLSSR